MELRDFIKKTLLEITEGVLDAQKTLIDKDCKVNPSTFAENGKAIKAGYQNNYRNVQIVKFNVGLSITENKESKSGIGVASIINAGVSSEKIASNEKVTSIEFEIPISLPNSK